MAGKEQDEEKKEEWQLNPTHFSKWYQDPSASEGGFNDSLRTVKNQRKTEYSDS